MGQTAGQTLTTSEAAISVAKSRAHRATGSDAILWAGIAAHISLRYGDLDEMAVDARTWAIDLANRLGVDDARERWNRYMQSAWEATRSPQHHL